MRVLLNQGLQQSYSRSVTLLAIMMMVVTLPGCGSQPEKRSVESVTSNHTRFETAIAEKILGEAVSTLPLVPAPQRLGYLQNYLRQFESGVDQSRVSTRIRREGVLLRYLTETQTALQGEIGLGAKVHQLSGLNWSVSEFENRFNQELQRIDHRLLANNPQGDIQLLVENQRSSALYRTDSPDSKQQYLDDLSTAMLVTQADWHDLLIEYSPSVLAITGHESAAGPTFSYDRRGLTINLDNPDDLPGFEIECIAAYYGYPGLQAFASPKGNSIRTLLNLPGYTAGWASYVVDLISEEAEHQQCLWYSRLQGAAAIADLNLNRGYWDEQTTLEYLRQNTPYHQSRLSGVITEITTAPGRYAAVFAGRIFFRALMTGCQQSTLDQCLAEVHQKIIDLGPIPFPMLIKDLERMSGFAVPTSLVSNPPRAQQAPSN